MSWLARSIANGLHLSEEQNDVVTGGAANSSSEIDTREEDGSPNYDDDLNYNNLGGGVKEDLSEFTETLTRQFWGVASFLAPLLPPNSDLFGRSDPDCVSNIEDDEDEDAVGVTEEVLAFAMNIAHHPETWLDFPLSDHDDHDFDDFELSDTQQKHAYAVERLTPRLAALRVELCPAHMSEGYFWMVYFVLLHSRLNKHDAELLSTPQLVEARAMWMQELQKKTKPESDWFGIGTFHAKESIYSLHGDFESNSSEDAHSKYVVFPRAFSFEPPTCHTTSDTETEKRSFENTEIQFVDKTVIEEDPPSKIIDMEVATGPSSKPPMFDYDEHEDDWLKDNSELEGYSGTTIGNEEDVSFSDLEDDIDCTVTTKPKSVSIKYNTALNTL